MTFTAASATSGSICEAGTFSQQTGSRTPAACSPDGASWPARKVSTAGSPGSGAEVFTNELRAIDDGNWTMGGVEAVEICLRKPDVGGCERASLERLLNRTNTSVASANRHAFLAFD